MRYDIAESVNYRELVHRVQLGEEFRLAIFDLWFSGNTIRVLASDSEHTIKEHSFDITQEFPTIVLNDIIKPNSNAQQIELSSDSLSMFLCSWSADYILNKDQAGFYFYTDNKFRYVFPINILDNGFINIMVVNQSPFKILFIAIPLVVYLTRYGYDYPPDYMTLTGQSLNIPKEVIQLETEEQKSFKEVQNTLSIFSDTEFEYGYATLKVDKFYNLVEVKETCRYQIMDLKQVRRVQFCPLEFTLIPDYTLLGNTESLISDADLEALFSDSSITHLCIFDLNSLPLGLFNNKQLRVQIVLTMEQFIGNIGDQLVSHMLSDNQIRAIHIMKDTSLYGVMMERPEYTIGIKTDWLSTLGKISIDRYDTNTIRSSLIGSLQNNTMLNTNKLYEICQKANIKIKEWWIPREEIEEQPLKAQTYVENIKASPVALQLIKGIMLGREQCI